MLIIITLHPLYFVRSGIVATAMYLNGANGYTRISSNAAGNMERNYRLQIKTEDTSVGMNDFRFQAASLCF